MGIYGFKNKIDGKWYIGQSVCISDRKNYHLNQLLNNKHFNEHFQLAFNKYGEEAFEFHILEELIQPMLGIRECHWIAYYKSKEREFGYNLLNGGNVQNYHSDETRKKRSDSLKGKKLSEDHKRKLKLAHKGFIGLTHSKEACKKISLARKGMKFSETHIENLKKAHLGKVSGMLGKKHSEETKKKISLSKKMRKLLLQNKVEGISNNV